MREQQAGLWHRQTPHPEWASGEPWPQEVSSYAIDDGARLLLFDPLSVPDDLLELAADRETAVVLTAPWHERDTQSLVEPRRARLHATARYRRRPHAAVRHHRRAGGRRKP